MLETLVEMYEHKNKENLNKLKEIYGLDKIEKFLSLLKKIEYTLNKFSNDIAWIISQKGVNFYTRHLDLNGCKFLDVNLKSKRGDVKFCLYDGKEKILSSNYTFLKNYGSFCRTEPVPFNFWNNVEPIIGKSYIARNKKSLNTRTQKEMINDLEYILKGPISQGGKLNNIKDVCVEWTQIYGKYEKCKYWSKDALNLYKQNNSTNGLIHEHLIPKNIVTKNIINIDPDNITKNKISGILKRNLIGVVVTTNEDNYLKELGFQQNMPEDYYDEESKFYNNRWLRYIKAEITVFKVKWYKNEIINIEKLNIT